MCDLIEDLIEERRKVAHIEMEPIVIIENEITSKIEAIYSVARELKEYDLTDKQIEQIIQNQLVKVGELKRTMFIMINRYAEGKFREGLEKGERNGTINSKDKVEAKLKKALEVLVANGMSEDEAKKLLDLELE